MIIARIEKYLIATVRIPPFPAGLLRQSASSLEGAIVRIGRRTDHQSRDIEHCNVFVRLRKSYIRL